MQKSETDADPPLGGWGAGSKAPTQKIFHFYYYWLQYQKPLGPYTG